MKIFNKFVDVFSNKTKIMHAENKILVVGLGNIGNKYHNTRHNIGFDCVDNIATKYSCNFIDSRYAFFASFKIKNKHVFLIKPTTFMNLCGKAVLYYLKKEKISLNNLLIITDDIALPLGQIRIRKKGGAGGHNGIQNIIDDLNTYNFSRLRVGISNNFSKGNQSNYVLSEWEEEEKKELLPIIEKTTKAVESFALSGVDISMNLFNKK